MSDQLDRDGEVYPKRAQIRKDRRAAQIADAYDLRREGPWVYSIVRDPASTGPLAEPHAMVFEYRGTEAEVTVPTEIAGYPVLELYNKVFHDKRALRAVTLPDCVLRVGLKVFSRSASLESVRLSDSLEAIDPASFLGCARLSRVHLPASLLVLEDRLLSGCSVGYIGLGPALREFGWTAAKHPALRRVSIDRANPRFVTDGSGIYTRDGTVLLRLVVTSESYAPLPGLERVEGSACKNLRGLERIELGRHVEEIGPYAFFGTGLREVTLPPSVRRVDSHAFANCGALARVRFSEGLSEVGESAFSGTALRAASLPASLRYLYTDAFEKTPLMEGGRSGAGRGVDGSDGGDGSDDGGCCDGRGGGGVSAIAIDPANPRLTTDGRVLYERGSRGLVALGAFGRPERVRLLPGTVAVETGAFERQPELREAVFPRGLARIGDRAFRSCPRLSRADFPDSLEEIGEEAFARTALTEARIGCRLARIGERAFMAVSADRGSTGGAVGGAAGGAVLPVLRVEDGNPAFYLAGGLLCERRRGGGWRAAGTRGGALGSGSGARGDAAVLFTGAATEVRIPAGVSEVRTYAFMRAPVRRLEIPATVNRIERDAFNGMDRLEELVIEYDPPLEGHARVGLVFPGDANSAEGLARSLAFDHDGRLFRYAAYDTWVVHYWLLNKRNAGRVARMVLARLDCPVKLSAGAREQFETCLRTLLPVACEDFARRRDLEAFARLERHGFINVGNIDEVLRGAEARGEAETTAYLLRMKSKKFGIGKRDFSL